MLLAPPPLSGPSNGTNGTNGTNVTSPVGAPAVAETLGGPPAAPVATYPSPLPPPPHAASTPPRQTTAVDAPIRAHRRPGVVVVHIRRSIGPW
ncbi:hypothetical protein [Streptomyces caeruleatus]|uniref:hypothetical protein n=1 Tax=Streptomyces caeruleatus TaxID=661399 RepID=UPI000787FE8E